MNATLIASAAALAVVSAAHAQTIATFADPAGGPGTPLFAFNAATGTLTGGWAGTGLLLQTPGLLAVPYFAGAHFTITPISTVSNTGLVYNMGGGQINFTDSANNPLLTITFSNSTMLYALGLSSSTFSGNNVTFSGPIIGGTPFSSATQFSFSFANPVATAPVGVDSAGRPVNSFTVTSSFTSSAPAPGAMALLGFGGLFAARRRR